VLDNLNTHSPAAFYEAFSPQQAWNLTKNWSFTTRPSIAPQRQVLGGTSLPGLVTEENHAAAKAAFV